MLYIIDISCQKLVFPRPRWKKQPAYSFHSDWVKYNIQNTYFFWWFWYCDECLPIKVCSFRENVCSWSGGPFHCWTVQKLLLCLSACLLANVFKTRKSGNKSNYIYTGRFEAELIVLYNMFSRKMVWSANSIGSSSMALSEANGC